ncbi:hypothetical protein MNBD_ALPHA12-351, partial [hydrothermal vent metagenome]
FVSRVYMPRGAHRICHDALNPRCVKCCPCGGAAKKLADLLFFHLNS